MIANAFGKGPEGWCSYDYHASVVADGRNIFVLAAWQDEGGAGHGATLTDSPAPPGRAEFATTFVTADTMSVHTTGA